MGSPSDAKSQFINGAPACPVTSKPLLNNYISYEHFLAHEYMHVKRIRDAYQIDDLKTTELSMVFLHRCMVHNTAKRLLG